MATWVPEGQRRGNGDHGNNRKQAPNLPGTLLPLARLDTGRGSQELLVSHGGEYAGSLSLVGPRKRLTKIVSTAFQAVACRPQFGRSGRLRRPSTVPIAEPATDRRKPCLGQVGAASARARRAILNRDGKPDLVDASRAVFLPLLSR